MFILYDVSYGLDAQLALRKVEVLRVEDLMFQNYLKCQNEAHNQFLTFFFKGNTYKEMELDPFSSKDLNHGVPPFYNSMLDELLDGTAASFLLEKC